MLDGCELVAVVDIDLERATAIADTHGASAYATIDEVLDKVDAVSVATPTSTHYEVASTFLKHGIHVLVEKPMTATVAQAEELIVLAEEKSLVLQVGHQERFFVAQLDLSMLANGSPPTEILCERTGPFTGRSVDCSVIVDLMIHDIDLAQSFVRSPVTGVIGLGTPSVTEHPDEADVTLYHANGCSVRLIASRASEGRRRTARIVQAEGTVEIDFLARTCTHSKLGAIEPHYREVNGSMNGRRALAHDNLGQELAAFIDTVAMGGIPMVTGEDGRRALETALLIEANLNPVLKAVGAR